MILLVLLCKGCKTRSSNTGACLVNGLDANYRCTDGVGLTCSGGTCGCNVLVFKFKIL
jgi:hypothetical protein